MLRAYIQNLMSLHFYLKTRTLMLYVFQKPGSLVLRCDRCTRGGGVAIYVKKHLQCREKYRSIQNYACEYLFLEIKGLESNVLLRAIYRPSRNIEVETLLERIKEITISNSNVLICGDLNCDLLTDTSFLKAWRPWIYSQ